MSVTVRDATESQGSDWNAFIGASAEGSFYHLYEWRELIERQFRHETRYLVASDEGRIVGVLPLVMVASRTFGRILCSMPFVNYGGPCALSDMVRSELVARAISVSREVCADYLELRCATPMPVSLPVSLRKISMTLCLDRNPDVLWSAFDSKHRKNVRRAYKNGLHVQAGGVELLPDFYAILERAWRALGTPLYHAEYFRAILKSFPTATSVYVCYRSNRPVSVAMVGFHGGKAEGLWQGSSPEGRELQANYVLYWEMIRDVCVRGYNQFHLGRSTADSGAEMFKSRWNAEATQLYWYFHRPDAGQMPALNVDNPRYRLAIAAWRRLPLMVTRRIGPVLARSIP